jgi:RNA recognition motif-containing protein
MNLYVSNLGEQITDESLRVIFATHGNVSSSRIIKDRFSGYSRGFGFVDMPDDDEAQNAIEKINGMVVNGKNVSVTEARPRPEQRGSLIDRLKNW